jgi:hypothetical protein
VYTEDPVKSLRDLGYNAYLRGNGNTLEI